MVPRIILTEQLKCEILKHKPELKEQIQCICSGKNKYDENKLVTICVFNSVNRVAENAENFHKIFVDEAHHIYTPDIYRMDDEDEYEEDEDWEYGYFDKNEWVKLYED